MRVGMNVFIRATARNHSDSVIGLVGGFMLKKEACGSPSLFESWQGTLNLKPY